MQTPKDRPLIHVALVEDDVHFQHAICAAIKASDDMKLVSLAGTHTEGMRALQQAPADVLLVDLGLPDGSGIDVIRAAQVQWPTCAVMVCTTFGDEAHVLRSIEAGAAGYLLKDGAPASMLDEIRILHGGGSPISPLIARQILTRFRDRGGLQNTASSAHAGAGVVPAPPIARRTTDIDADDSLALSSREREVLGLITKGFTAEEIARLMQISVHTVQTYVRRVYSKLKVNSKAEAIYEARHQGLV
ncbi:MAG: response regulator transcription factor [Hydrogenophaga sp.]|nr:response regulator transcription factor [Hydrogenophaga sp.]